MRLVPLILLAGFAAAPSSADPPTPPMVLSGEVDLLIEDATVVDGTGSKPFAADVAIRGADILYVGQIPPGTIRAKIVIPANGRVLSPGFIDMHAHGDVVTDDFSSYLAMGVTTVVLGQDGESPDYARPVDQPASSDRGLAEWMREVGKRGVQVNVVPLTGHATIRRRAGIPNTTRHLLPAQQRRMNDLLAADLQAGSFGFSTGLEYVPGRFSETAELRPLGKLVAGVDGIVLSHMRTEDAGEIEGAINELVDYGSSARVHISHLKVVFGKGEETAHRLLTFIAAKQQAGVRLSADMYPYSAGYSSLGLIFPEWALLPPADYAKVVQTRREELLAYLRTRMTRRGGPKAFLFGSAPFAGKTLADVANEQGRPYEEVLLALGPGGGHGAHFVMDEALQDVLVTSPLTSISTDGGPGSRHPRSTGTYARLIEHYVVGERLLSLQEAVRKCSGLPASLLHLPDRGIIRAGFKADLLLFDPAKVRARSDYMHPFETAKGFDLVVVNGAIARRNDVADAGRHGRLLTHRPITQTDTGGKAIS